MVMCCTAIVRGAARWAAFLYLKHQRLFASTLRRGFDSRRPLKAQSLHRLIRITAIAAMVMARAISIHPESVGTVNADTLRMAEAGPPDGTPVPVTCEVVFVIWPGIVACMMMGTLHDAPAPRVTLLSVQPLPLKAALPALQV